MVTEIWITEGEDRVRLSEFRVATNGMIEGNHGFLDTVRPDRLSFDIKQTFKSLGSGRFAIEYVPLKAQPSLKNF